MRSVNTKISKPFSLELEKNKDKEVGLQEFTKVSADETNTTTTELTNTTATAKQIDSDQTPVDDVDDPLESERHTEVQLSGSTKVQTQAMDVDKGEEEEVPEVIEVQSVADQEMDVDDDGGDEDEIEVHPDTSSKRRANEATGFFI